MEEWHRTPRRGLLGCNRHDLPGPKTSSGDLEQRGGEGILRPAHDRNLERRAEREIERDQPLPERGRIAAEQPGDLGQRRLRGRPIALFPGYRGESEQHNGRHGVPGRQRVVLDVLRTSHQRLVVVGGVEEPGGRVCEALQHGVHELTGRDEPAVLEGGLVQREQAVGEVAVVLEHAVARCAAVLPGSLQPPARSAEAVEDGVRGLDGDRAIGPRGLAIVRIL